MGCPPSARGDIVTEGDGAKESGQTVGWRGAGAAGGGRRHEPPSPPALMDQACHFQPQTQQWDPHVTNSSLAEEIRKIALAAATREAAMGKALLVRRGKSMAVKVLSKLLQSSLSQGNRSHFGGPSAFPSLED